jgi:hypothetical protein
MDHLMVRQSGVYELTETGQAVWRVECFLKDHWPGALREASPGASAAQSDRSRPA